MGSAQLAPGEPDDLIRLDGVTKAYQSGGAPALAEVTLGVADGEVAAIMGPSGSGKSTLLNLIAGLDRPTRGTVKVAGQRIDNLGESALARFRARHVGIVFQFFNLLDDLTVEDNVLLPAQLAGDSRPRARKRADELLARLGLERLRGQYPAVAAGLGVLNTVLMTTRDRIHDLGVFKALGMRPGQVVSMVTGWVIGPAVIAAVIAAPAAVLLNTATVHAMAGAAHSGIPASYTDVFPVPRLALLSLAALAIAVIGALLPAAWAARARPATALRSE